MTELPTPAHRGPSGTGSYFDAFTADQMRAYGRANFELALQSDGDYIRAVISDQ
jgi:hypothetical protein